MNGGESCNVMVGWQVGELFGGGGVGRIGNVSLRLAIFGDLIEVG